MAYEHPVVVAAAPENRTVPLTLVPMDGVPSTATDLPIHPPSLERALLALRDRYPRLPPVYVTTGSAFDDPPDDAPDDPLDGAPDRERIDFIDGHLAAIGRAAAAGVPIGGYFHRSLLDGWEGAAGRQPRTGLVRADPGSPERAPRASFAHVRSMIAASRR